jgi:hypothetical protein
LRALAILKKSFGSDHPNIKIYGKNLQILQQQQATASLTWWQWLIAIPFIPFILLFIPFILLWQLLLWLLHLFRR